MSISMNAIKRRYWDLLGAFRRMARECTYDRLRFRWRLSQMTRRGECVDVSGVQIRLGPHLSRGMREVIASGEYEAAESSIVARHVGNDDVVMELGAGLGYISTLIAKKIGSGKVFAYEANPVLESIIQETYKLNAVSPSLIMCMLGQRAGEQTFFVMKDFWSSSTVRRDRRAKEVSVPVRAVNDEIARIKPTFLIVDIEGGEYELFRSIDLSTVNKVAIELHERIIGADKARSVMDTLTGAGLSLREEMSGPEQLFYARAGRAGSKIGC